MRSSIILGALCALGAMAEIEPSYVTTWTTTTVTDWTIVTITKTITVQPTSEPTVEPTTAPSEVKVQEPETVEEKTTTTTSQAPAAVETSWSSTWTTTWESTSIATQEPTTTTTTTTQATQSAEPTTNTYQGNVLYSHNIHRSNHSSTDLTWSSDLEASAQTLAASCVYQHDTSINGGGYGQNIGYGVSSDEVAVMISNLMYNDEAPYFENLYGEASPDMSLFEKWGHFSQIVWKGTTQVGCATVVCDSLGNVDSASSVPFTVCNYSPPGNYDGEYADNIDRPLGYASYSA